MPFTKPVVVIDNGSFDIKAGFACDNHPVSIFRTVVGRPKYLNGSYGKGHYDVYIGEDAIARRHELELDYPVVKGKITNWDNMERIWHHVFYRELKAAPEDRAVMLSCAPPTTMKDKVKCCEIFFETLNAPALCVKPQSILALYGSGLTTGLSVDLGHVMTEINPIYEGGSINYANMITNVAGDTVYTVFKDMLDKRGYDFGTETKTIIHNMRRSCLYVTENCAVSKEMYQRKFKLPSGEEIDVSDEAFMAGEMYFQPELILGKEAEAIPIHEGLVTTVMKCDSELQTEFYDAVIIHGGMAAALPGFYKRLAKEVEEIINRPINIIKSPEAYCVAWLGGATFAGMSDAKKIWVYKKQFDEQGERIVKNRF